jgi:phospholipid transport system substrate-binding protein
VWRVQKVTTSGLAWVMLFCLVFPTTSSAGKPTDQVRNTIESVLRVIHGGQRGVDRSTEQRRAQLSDILHARFDSQEMAKRSLGLTGRLVA